MVDFQYKDSYGVKDLEEIVRLLRAPGGCPWDAEQTHQSIRRNFLEEAYEAVEAIDEGSPEHLKEELGDVLLQVVFHALMEQEAGRFDLDAVADGICKKLIFRHPHVFGEVSVSGTGEVLSNWEELKRKEKGQATNTDALEAVARSLPALWRAGAGGAEDRRGRGHQCGGGAGRSALLRRQRLPFREGGHRGGPQRGHRQVHRPLPQGGRGGRPAGPRPGGHELGGIGQAMGARKRDLRAGSP